jgi:hypothetical protein
MIVLNVTAKVEHSIEDAWLLWNKEEQIPAIMATGLFTDWQLFKLLEQDDTDGSTYVMQFFIPAIENYQRYIQDFALPLKQKEIEKWGSGLVSFRTTMQVVN